MSNITKHTANKDLAIYKARHEGVKVQDMEIRDLQNLSFKVLAKTFIELGQRKEKEDLVILAQLLAEDLTHHKLTDQEVWLIFRDGVRNHMEDEVTVNVRLWSKWIKAYLDKRMRAPRPEIQQERPEPSEIEKWEISREFITEIFIPALEDHLLDDKDIPDRLFLPTFQVLDKLDQLIKGLDHRMEILEACKLKAQDMIKEKRRRKISDPFSHLTAPKDVHGTAQHLARKEMVMDWIHSQEDQGMSSALTLTILIEEKIKSVKNS